MSANHEKHEPPHLNAEVELQINRVVEERLTNLPAKTFKLIQAEVDDRVKKAERHYFQMAVAITTAVTILIGGVLFGIYKFTIRSATEQVAKEIASTEVKKQAVMIEDLWAQSQNAKNRTVLAAVEAASNSETIGLRLRELQKADNIVRYGLGGTLTLRPVDGILRLQGGSGLEYQIVLEGLGSRFVLLGPNGKTNEVGGMTISP